MTLQTQITEAVAAVDFGKADALKRGRFQATRPWVPVLWHWVVGQNRFRQEQLLGVAYPTKAEAIAYASRTIEARRADLARKLAQPRYRALREQHGLPRELPAE